jgi:putative aldouronate transport system permease protein
MTHRISIRERLRRTWPLYVLLLPGLVYLLVFHYYPMYGLQIAFKDFKFGHGITGSPWVGFKHFARFFQSYQFTRVLTNTVILSGYSILAGFPMRIMLSLSLHVVRSNMYKKIVQTATYLPHFISTVVMVGILMRFFNPILGVFSQLIQALGGTERDVMGLPAAFPHLYVWSGIWQHAGWGTIIYLATLASVDLQLHEAAIIDGASRMQRVVHIDIPAIVPTAVIILIMDMGSILSVGFEKVLLMQNALNIAASEVISTYVYKIGIASGRPNYSLGAAVGLFNSAVNFGMIVLVNGIAKALKQETLW